MQPKAGSHLPHVDGVRALLALYVVVHHSYLSIWPIDRGAALPPPTVGRLVNWLLFGRLAVAGFIAVSGYCLMLPVARGNRTLRGGAGRFYLKRARRILPTFYAALILCTVVGLTIARHFTGTVWDAALPITANAVAVNLLMIQNLVARHQINYAFWSIALEWQIYFAFPLLVILFRRVGPNWTTAAVVVMTVAAHKLLGKTILSHLAIHYLGIFTLGMFAAAVSYGESPWPWNNASLTRILAAAATLVMVALCYYWGGADTPALASEMLAGATLTLWLIVWGRSTASISKSILQWGPLYLVGTFSYSLYLLHAPLIQIVWLTVIHPLHLTGLYGLFVLLAIALPVCIATSWAFFLVFERPFMSSHQRRAVVEAEAAITATSLPPASPNLT
jgi:peptidoglycan/LPS O-acetylase OafA/YrhL